MPRLFNVIRFCIFSLALVFSLVVLALAALLSSILEPSSLTTFVDLSLFVSILTMLCTSAILFFGSRERFRAITQTRYELVLSGIMALLWFILALYLSASPLPDVDCPDDDDGEVSSYTTEDFHAQYHMIQAFAVLELILLCGWTIFLFTLAMRHSLSGRKQVWNARVNEAPWFGLALGKGSPSANSSDEKLTRLPPPVSASTAARRERNASTGGSGGRIGGGLSALAAVVTGSRRSKHRRAESTPSAWRSNAVYGSGSRSRSGHARNNSSSSGGWGPDREHGGLRRHNSDRSGRTSDSDDDDRSSESSEAGLGRRPVVPASALPAVPTPSQSQSQSQSQSRSQSQYPTRPPAAVVYSSTRAGEAHARSRSEPAFVGGGPITYQPSTQQKSPYSNVPERPKPKPPISSMSASASAAALATPMPKRPNLSPRVAAATTASGAAKTATTGPTISTTGLPAPPVPSKSSPTTPIAAAAAATRSTSNRNNNNNNNSNNKSAPSPSSSTPPTRPSPAYKPAITQPLPIEKDSRRSRTSAGAKDLSRKGSSGSSSKYASAAGSAPRTPPIASMTPRTPPTASATTLARAASGSSRPYTRSPASSKPNLSRDNSGRSRTSVSALGQGQAQGSRSKATPDSIGGPRAAPYVRPSLARQPTTTTAAGPAVYVPSDAGSVLGAATGAGAAGGGGNGSSTRVDRDRSNNPYSVMPNGERRYSRFYYEASASASANGANGASGSGAGSGRSGRR